MPINYGFYKIKDPINYNTNSPYDFVERDEDFEFEERSRSPNWSP